MPDKTNIIKTDDKRMELLEKRDDVLNILYRLRGGLGSILYLMGGDSHTLAPPRDDIEMWILDLRERIDAAIEIAGEIRA